MYRNRIIYLFLFLFFILQSQVCFAGAPFSTDDPEPVDYKHVEFYFSSSHLIEQKTMSGNLLTAEMNYGLMPNMQIHFLLPLNYSFEENQSFKTGYANTELGVKYRFVDEKDNCPQIATYPTLSVPTIKNYDFSDGKLKVYLPLWAQKSWGQFTTYGGGGYWINTGTGNQNYVFSGWEAQYDLSEKLMLGGEVYYHTPSFVGEENVLAFNVGGSINFSKASHLLFSVGRNLIHENFTTAFLSFYWTP
jgi:hypothetical protein